MGGFELRSIQEVQQSMFINYPVCRTVLKLKEPRRITSIFCLGYGASLSHMKLHTGAHLFESLVHRDQRQRVL